jgi:hypothetical protein
VCFGWEFCFLVSVRVSCASAARKVGARLFVFSFSVEVTPRWEGPWAVCSSSIVCFHMVCMCEQR